MEDTLVGNIYMWIGLLTHQMDRAEELYYKHKDNPPKDIDTVRKWCDKALDELGDCDEFKTTAVLVVDTDDVYSPRVTLMIDNHLLPLRKDGVVPPLFMSPSAEVEYIYSEEDER